MATKAIKFNNGTHDLMPVSVASVVQFSYGTGVMSVQDALSTVINAESTNGHTMVATSSSAGVVNASNSTGAYLNIVCRNGNGVASSTFVKGSGATTVSSDSSGNVVINTPVAGHTYMSGYAQTGDTPVDLSTSPYIKFVKSNNSQPVGVKTVSAFGSYTYINIEHSTTSTNGVADGVVSSSNEISLINGLTSDGYGHINGYSYKSLTLGSAAFSNTDDFATSEHTHTADIKTTASTTTASQQIQVKIDNGTYSSAISLDKGGSTYGVVIVDNTVTNGSGNAVSGDAVYSYVGEALSGITGALVFKGLVDYDPEPGDSGEAGWVVMNKTTGKEWVHDGVVWREFGDEKSHASKNTTVTGDGMVVVPANTTLGNTEISLSHKKTTSAKAETIGNSTGGTQVAKGTLTINVPNLGVDAYGHVTSYGWATYSILDTDTNSAKVHLGSETTDHKIPVYVGTTVTDTDSVIYFKEGSNVTMDVSDNVITLNAADTLISAVNSNNGTDVNLDSGSRFSFISDISASGNTITYTKSTYVLPTLDTTISYSVSTTTVDDFTLPITFGTIAPIAKLANSSSTGSGTIFPSGNNEEIGEPAVPGGDNDDDGIGEGGGEGENPGGLDDNFFG